MILHWLGEMFDPALRGYWGARTSTTAAATVLELIDRARRPGGRRQGVASWTRAGRCRCGGGCRPGSGSTPGTTSTTPSLIRGDADGSHSDALLGVFAAITAPAAAALAALDRGDLAGYDAAMEPTVPLCRQIFEPPTYHYKTGVVFLAWLNGQQPQFAMLGGLQRRARPGT